MIKYYQILQLVIFSFENDLVAPSHVAARYGSVASLYSLAKMGFEILVPDINKV